RAGGRSRMKVAVHAGQLLQPVPGGIGRYVHSLLRVLPAAGVDAFAFAAGARPPGVPRRTVWVDLGPPHGGVRYEMWHRLRRPSLRLDADVVHATSLVVPPVHEAPLVVTVHDVAFLRVPDVTTRRGVSFHRRGLELTRREADLVIAVSAFPRDALLRRANACCIASRYEGFGLPALEAIVRGTPLAAASGSSVEEVVAGAALLFPPGDVDACADALERLLDDDALRAHLAERGRARTGEFTWQLCAETHAA